MANRRAMVTVCHEGISALEEPRFLIQADGKLYLTAAVLEYDPEHPELQDEHRQTIGDLQRQLETGEKVPAVRLRPTRITAALIASNMVGPGVGDGGTGGGDA